MRIRLLSTIAAICVATSVQAAPAFADPNEVGYRGWGPRVGVTVDPDQLHFGLHTDFGNFGRHVRFQPNVEVGLGDDLTLIAVNFEAAYRFSSKWDVWSPYLGGGLGVNFVRVERRFGDDTDSDVGVSILGGIERGLSSGSRFFSELKLGLSDSPDAKITFGWTFSG
ncbi:MAG: hypothetical protein ACKVU1_09700 [bacterium]